MSLVPKSGSVRNSSVWAWLQPRSLMAGTLFLALAAPAFPQVKVTVDMNKTRNFMGPRAMGIHASVYDNNLNDAEVPALLRAAGVTTLRYPGGGYADNYHWSIYKATKWQASDPPKYGYYATNNDFGHFVALIDQVGTTVITVNYGSNLEGTGGGEPAEAAAWVAYANGNPSDTRVIGKDSTGYDWQTVGSWASLRASSPLAVDDGKNFLRIGHPQGLNVKYWEIGNEVFGNGYYGGEGFEEDLHAPYPKDAKNNEKERQKNARLSPETYGSNVVEFAKAMKAVDPRISIGAVLDTPGTSSAGSWVEDWVQDPVTRQYGPQRRYVPSNNAALDWDQKVLKMAGKNIDFVIIHWYTGNLLPPDWKVLDVPSLLAAPQEELPKIIAALLEMFQKYCGPNAQNMQLAVTELGSRPFAKVTDEFAFGLFAADAYASLIEVGAVNIDWLELHNNSFLDTKNKPGPAYFGIQMVHYLLNMREVLVASTLSQKLLTVHAAKHADGSLGLMLINKDPKNAATLKVTVSGAKLASSGMRHDFGRSNLASGNSAAGTPITDLGNTFTVTVPAYTITDLSIPKLP